MKKFTISRIFRISSSGYENFLGIYISFQATFRKAKTDNAVGYFLAGRSMPWILVM